MQNSKVHALSISEQHTFSKNLVNEVVVIAGIGIKGDAHAGVTVKHRSRVAKDPTQPNLRQIHLIHLELLSDLKTKGYIVKPGDLGENITTTGISLLDLPKDTILTIGENVEIQITGLRNPCHQIDKFQKGLLKEVVGKNDAGEIVRMAGIMGIVLKGGIIKVNDTIQIAYPDLPYQKLERV